MPHLWLRVAVALYSLGLVYALVALSGRRQRFGRIILPVLALATTLHFVSLAEVFAATGDPAPVTIYQFESVFAFILMVSFFGVYWRYKTTSPGILVFPLVFLLSLSATLGEHPVQFTTPLLRNGWIILHITLILGGYAALFFSFASSIIYLIQERSIKSKRLHGLLARLPALEVMDDLGVRALQLGFPFMTLGLIAGCVIAQVSFGPAYFLDPKILLTLLMWAVYLVLLFTRWSAGWRGRRAAILSTVAFIAATLAWSASFFSNVHRYLRP
jgi:ABC-type uncharacterized transport system permease subunit